MARVLFLTWDGAGNQPPAAALAAALNRQRHTVVFAGNEHQRHYFAKRGFAFVLLGRAAGRWRQEAQECMFAVKREAVWACPEHIDDVPQLMAQENCGAVVIDCLMFGALAAAEKLRLPAAAFIHSAPGAIMPPGGPFEAQLFAAVNQLREESGLSSLPSLWEAWAPFPAISNSIRALDPFASRAPRSFQYCGPTFEQELGRAKVDGPLAICGRPPACAGEFFNLLLLGSEPAHSQDAPRLGRWPVSRAGDRRTSPR